MTIRAHITGFEGGTAGPNNWDITGNVTVSATAARSGDYGMICNASAAAAYADHSIGATTYYHQGRFYFRVPTLPASNMRIARMQSGTDGYEFKYRASDGLLICEAYDGGVLSETVVGPVLARNEWTRIDWMTTGGSAGTETIQWRVNGVAPPQIAPVTTYAGAVQNVFYGHNAALADAIIHFDDIVTVNSTASGDSAAMTAMYPLGPGHVKKLSVVGVGTHYLPQYFRASSGSLDNSWSLLTTTPVASGSYIEQIGVHLSAYLEYRFQQFTLPLTSSDMVPGVGLNLYATSNGLNSNDLKVWMVDSSYATRYYAGLWIGTQWIDADNGGNGIPMTGTSTSQWSESTPWTAERINTLKMRVGYSDDVNGIPQLQDAFIEVAIQESEDYRNPVLGRAASPWIDPFAHG